MDYPTSYYAHSLPLSQTAIAFRLEKKKGDAVTVCTAKVRKGFIHCDRDLKCCLSHPSLTFLSQNASAHSRSV